MAKKVQIANVHMYIMDFLYREVKQIVNLGVCQAKVMFVTISEDKIYMMSHLKMSIMKENHSSFIVSQDNHDQYHHST